jgi:rSAM/selenodomain-associated transferase 2/rSAM/selenodomain-associated transferase 1
MTRSPDGSGRRERLVLFTRFPFPGDTKTRLIPALGPEGATRLHRRLTLRALRAAETASQRRGADLQVCFSGATEDAMAHWLGDRFRFRTQAEGDLGAKMLAAFTESAKDGFNATVLIGADCPDLSPEVIAEAFDRLQSHAVVFGPATDGGYYLIGLVAPLPELFSGPTWGSASVLADSLARLKHIGIEPALLSPLSDIDRPEDLPLWLKASAFESGALSHVSVIIPALNEARHIEAALSAANPASPFEVIVVDGGSQDDTRTLAIRAGATLVKSGRGRARQMNAGASRATGNVLLFLHADTVLPPAYPALITRALEDQSAVAGAFRFAFRKSFPGSKTVEFTTNLRSRWRQMPFGDQALFLRRAQFEELGGFADLPILEDYDLVRRLRRIGRVVTLQQPARTSGRRWQELGVVRTTLINRWMIFGYCLGWPVDRLANTYTRVGRPSPPGAVSAPKL